MSSERADHDETCDCAECVRERRIEDDQWDADLEDAQRSAVEDALRVRTDDTKLQGAARRHAYRTGNTEVDL